MLQINMDSTFSEYDLGSFAVEAVPKYVEKRGFIYLVRDTVFPDFIKIGRTANIGKRLMAYNNDKPYNTTELICISGLFDNVIGVENKILERLYKETSPTTFKKEWFKEEYTDLCISLIKEAESTFDMV